MKLDTMRRAVSVLGLVLPMTWMSGVAEGQMRAGAQASSYGVAVTTALVNQKTPYAVLPAGGDLAQDQGPSVSVPGLVTASDLFAIATGDADDEYGSNAVSTATLGAVSLLNGLITADGVVAIASSTIGGGLTSSDADGSSIGNLVVNGVSLADPAPNTRVNLPGVGYAVFNEQQALGDGVTSTGITVNMIHVVLTNFLGQKTGEIVLGSATSSVQ